MDNDLRRLGGRRLPSRILDVDLPDIARAITSVMRGQASAQVFRSGAVGYVRITGRGLDTIVAAPDWERILPVIRDETLSTAFFPVESAVRPLDSSLRLSSSTVGVSDPLYPRVLGILSLLFTTKVPT